MTKEKKSGEPMCAACLSRMRDADTIEQYLVEVVDRVVDAEITAKANIMYCGTRKEQLLSTGLSFAYDQGRIDCATEILKFISGKEKLADVIKAFDEINAKIAKEQQTGGVPMDGMEVI